MERCDNALTDLEILQVAENFPEGIKEIPRVISKTPRRPLIRTARLAKDFVGEHVAADSRGQGGERNYNFGNRWDSTESDRTGPRNLNQFRLNQPTR